MGRSSAWGDERPVTGSPIGRGYPGMVGTFACPECGSAVLPRGHSPGRRVRCRECGTLVEVPFLPRASGRRRSRKRVRGWVWAGGGIAVAVLMVVVAVTKAR